MKRTPVILISFVILVLSVTVLFTTPLNEMSSFACCILATINMLTASVIIYNLKEI